MRGADKAIPRLMTPIISSIGTVTLSRGDRHASLDAAFLNELSQRCRALTNDAVRGKFQRFRRLHERSLAASETGADYNVSQEIQEQLR